VGSSTPWLLLLMVSDGQVGFGTMLALSLVGGGLLGALAISLRRGVPPRRRRPAPASERSPDGYVDDGLTPEPVGSPTKGLDISPITSIPRDDDLTGDR
jgi:hypothetical protein